MDAHRSATLDTWDEWSQPSERIPTNTVVSEDRAGIFSAVQHKRFRPLWTGSIMSGVGYMTALTACGWVAYELHHHSSTVGLVVFASFLPSFIITPFAGVFADRYDRRTMLLITNALGLLSTLGLASSGRLLFENSCRKIGNIDQIADENFRAGDP